MVLVTLEEFRKLYVDLKDGPCYGVDVTYILSA